MNTSISELVPINTPIMSVTPEKTHHNIAVTYSLADRKSPVFTIDERTGFITVNQELDRETKSMYNVTVHANIQESQAVAYVVYIRTGCQMTTVQCLIRGFMKLS